MAPLTVLFDYPPSIRRAIYATNAIESLHYSLRKATPPAALIIADSLMFDGIRKMAIMSL
jgi:transposase-like protein